MQRTKLISYQAMFWPSFGRYGRKLLAFYVIEEGALASIGQSYDHNCIFKARQYFTLCFFPVHSVHEIAYHSNVSGQVRYCTDTQLAQISRALAFAKYALEYPLKQATSRWLFYRAVLLISGHTLFPS